MQVPCTMTSSKVPSGRDVFFGGFKWTIIPGARLTKDEIEMLDRTLPMMEKRLQRAAKWIERFNRNDTADFQAFVTLDTIRHVPHSLKKGQKLRS